MLALAFLLTSAYGQDNSPEITQKDSSPTFQSKVNLVLVPVVVRDGQGRVVANLSKEDFQLFDKNKPQTIASFQVVRHAASADAQTPPANMAVQTAETPAVATVSAERYVAYLFDDLNSQPADLINAKKAAAAHLAGSLRGSDRAAIFSTSGQTTLDFTDDQAKLQAAIAKLQVRSMYQHAGRQCPDISYYMADLIVNKNDPNALQAAVQETIVCMAIDPTQPGAIQQATQMAKTSAQQELPVGDQATRVSLSVIKGIIHRMAVKPGQRLLVLASPGFLAQSSEAMSDKAQILDLAASANVMISSLNTRGLFTTEMDASQQGSYSVQAQILIQQYYRENLIAMEDVLAELADGTGGIFFHNNNDLNAGFARVATAPDVSYVLGFSPQAMKPDGSFHKLKISLVTRKDATIQARRGYYAVKRAGDAEADAKADIQDAIFSREEMHDIPVNLQTQFFKPAEDSAKLTVVAKVDLRRLRFKKEEGRNRDDLKVVAALFDRNGDFLMGLTKNVEMHLRDETLARLAAGISVKLNFDVKPGTYVVRLVVRDSEGQAMAAQNGAVEIP